MRLGFLLLFAAVLPSYTATERGAVVASSDVRLIPISVTLWPKDADIALCDEIPSLVTHGKLTVIANGTKRRISAFELAGTNTTQITSGSTARGAIGLNVVLLFDWWHMGETGCGSLDRSGFGNRALDELGNHTQGAGRAFDWARAFFTSTFRPGIDRVMIASFAGSLEIHSEEWIADPAEAIDLLDALEKNPRTSFAELRRTNLDDWFENLGLLAQALGNYPGVKDVFLLASDTPVDIDESTGLSRLSAHFQSSSAQLHVIDLAWDRRAGVIPYGLLPISEWTGGHFFTDSSAELATAVRVLRDVASCRISLYFEPDERERSVAFSSLGVTLDDDRFRLEAPKFYAKNPAKEEKELALTFLKHFEKGIAVQSGLIVDEPISLKRGTWRSYLTVRVSIKDPTIRITVRGIVIEATAINLDKKRPSVIVSHRLGGQHLADLLEGKRDSYTFAVPFTAQPGLTKVVVEAYGEDAFQEARASDHSDISLPSAPGPYWTVADRIARIAKATIATPALEDRIHAAQQVVAVGYACSDVLYDSDKKSPAPTGRFVSRSQTVSLHLVRTACPGGTLSKSGCGCFVGFAENQLRPGEWTVELPPDVQPRDPVSFEVLAAVSEATRR